LQIAAAAALARRKDPESVGALLKMLKDGQSRARAFSAQILGAIGDKSAVEPLKEALKDDDFQVRVEAKKALRRMVGFESS